MTAVLLRAPEHSSLPVFVIRYSLPAGAEAASLSGRVVDPDGRPVANADVIVPVWPPRRAGAIRQRGKFCSRIWMPVSIASRPAHPDS